jgi:hypothetical protein
MNELDSRKDRSLSVLRYRFGIRLDPLEGDRFIAELLLTQKTQQVIYIYIERERERKKERKRDRTATIVQDLSGI